MNLQDNPVLREKLAAEYVLGTLKGAARRRFEAWLRADAALRATVGRWQDRLAPMAELGQPVAPPARVWTGIERRLQLAPLAPWWQFWRVDAARPWAGIALAASSAAVVLAVLLATRLNGPDSAPQQVAALTDARAHTALVVTADAKRGRLDVRVAREVRVPDDRTLQLWAIDRAGKPRSLGILPDNRGAELALDGAIGPDVMLLAISLEPKGGSPDPNGPTGPVLYKGSWTRL
jgi:anti-sigma-K factor RskA